MSRRPPRRVRIALRDGVDLLRLARVRRLIGPGTVLVLYTDTNEAALADDDVLVLRRPVEIDHLTSYLWARLGAATSFRARSG